MRCKQARRELALWVGGDHDPRLEALLESHLAECPDCRAFSREIKGVLQPFREVASREFSAHIDESPSVGWSLWPRVRAQLLRRRVHFNDLLDAPVGWIPVSGLTVACLAIFAFVFSTSPVVPRHPSGTAFDGAISGLPVSHQFAGEGFRSEPVGGESRVFFDSGSTFNQFRSDSPFTSPVNPGIFEGQSRRRMTIPFPVESP